MRTRKWEDSEGKEKFSTEVIVDNFIFLDSKSERLDDQSDAVEPVVDVEDDDVPF
ncbi:single-stranded DNA-binding protein [Patescibacteria group bacterium]|nr:single-stranded DNA-binding protein [Patescibacteria group bacterium]MBU1758942.1 single-stranded DNA-binding protein [Patescibacteria group bacterium]